MCCLGISSVIAFSNCRYTGEGHVGIEVDVAGLQKLRRHLYMYHYRLNDPTLLLDRKENVPGKDFPNSEGTVLLCLAYGIAHTKKD